jgi:hypothetical protein
MQGITALKKDSGEKDITATGFFHGKRENPLSFVRR